MTSKYALRWAAILLLVGWTSSLAAQVPSTGKKPPAPGASPSSVPLASIAVIDIQVVLRQSTAAQGLQRQFKSEQDDFQAAIEKQQKGLKVADDELEKLRSSLSPEVFAERRRKLQERVTQVNGEFRLRRRQMEEVFNGAMAELQRNLNSVVEDIAKRSGVNMVLRKEAVLANVTALDLTQQTLDEFNRRVPTVKVAFPQRP